MRFHVWKQANGMQTRKYAPIVETNISYMYEQQFEQQNKLPHSLLTCQGRVLFTLVRAIDNKSLLISTSFLQINTH